MEGGRGIVKGIGSFAFICARSMDDFSHFKAAKGFAAATGRFTRAFVRSGLGYGCVVVVTAACWGGWGLGFDVVSCGRTGVY